MRGWRDGDPLWHNSHFNGKVLSCHLLLSFLTHALLIQTVMGPRPGGVGAWPTFLLLKNLPSLHELGVLAALRDVGSRLCELGGAL